MPPDSTPQVWRGSDETYPEFQDDEGWESDGTVNPDKETKDDVPGVVAQAKRLPVLPEMRAKNTAKTDIDPPPANSAPASPAWFLATNTWDIEQRPPQTPPEHFDVKTLDAFVVTIKDWLSLWVTQGHCPLIHRYLYPRGHDMPRCMQDAYFAAIMYYRKTPTGKSAVCRMLEERLIKIVGEAEAMGERGELTLQYLLASTQSLFVLIFVCLIDRNSQARGKKSLPILLTQRDLMWKRAKAQFRGQSNDPQDRWRPWIVAEAVRRTYLAASILNGLYTEGSPWCPGGVFCTFGAGIWDADTVVAWEERCAKEDKRVFMRSSDMSELFWSHKAGDVDDFGYAVLVVSFGLETVRGWDRSRGEKLSDRIREAREARKANSRRKR